MLVSPSPHTRCLQRDPFYLVPLGGCVAPHTAGVGELPSTGLVTAG